PQSCPTLRRSGREWQRPLGHARAEGVRGHGGDRVRGGRRRGAARERPTCGRGVRRLAVRPAVVVNRHAGPASPSDPQTPVPEPSYAERARTLVHLGRAGTLATLSRRHPGHPFASIITYAVAERANPLLRPSTMA